MNLICLTDLSDCNWPCETKVITREAKKNQPPTDWDQMGPSTWGPAEHWWHPHFKGNPQKKSEPVTFDSSQQTKKIKRWLLGFLNSIWYYPRNMQGIRPCTGWICHLSVLSRSPAEGIILGLEFLSCSGQLGVYGKGCLGRAHAFSSSAVLDLCTSETSWASKAQALLVCLALEHHAGMEAASPTGFTSLMDLAESMELCWLDLANDKTKKKQQI